MVAYLKDCGSLNNTIHEVTRSGSSLVVPFIVTSWIVLDEAKENTKLKLRHHQKSVTRELNGRIRSLPLAVL